PRDLLQRPSIEMRVGDNSSFAWELGNADSMISLGIKGPFCANETEAAVDAAIRSVGFVYCLERRIQAEIDSGVLQVVLPDWWSEGPPLQIYYPSRRQTPPGLRQLIDLIRDAEGLEPLVST